MTPTLRGRWETRGLLLATIGVGVTAVFGLLFGSFGPPFALLGYVLALGLGWDALYNVVQTYRWDHDWPPIFQLAAGIVEAALIWGLLQAVGLPGVDAGLTLGRFAAHYGSVWLLTFLFAQGPLRLLFPRWRFRGGQWL